MINLQDIAATSLERRSDLYRARSESYRLLAMAAQSDDVRRHFIRLTSRYEELAALEGDFRHGSLQSEGKARGH